MARVYETGHGAIGYKEISEMRVGRYRVPGSRPAGRGGATINDDQIVKMGKLRLQGWSCTQIAKELRVDTQSVINWMRRLELPVPAPHQPAGTRGPVRGEDTRLCRCGQCKRCKARQRYHARKNARSQTVAA